MSKECLGSRKKAIIPMPLSPDTSFSVVLLPQCTRKCAWVDSPPRGLVYGLIGLGISANPGISQISRVKISVRGLS